MRSILICLLFLLSFSAFSFTCSTYTFSNNSHDERYRYRLSYGDIPNDSPVIHLSAKKQGSLPARPGNLLLKLKRSDGQELSRCLYVVENKNGPIQGQPTFLSLGHSCPILIFDKCNIDISG
ncbi:MAG: hypothetical protein Q8L78_02195 [Coxiellaceae bacterium]|nr:hypothetical protein [Coxiellaceae bacterium]